MLSFRIYLIGNFLLQRLFQSLCPTFDDPLFFSRSWSFIAQKLSFSVQFCLYLVILEISKHEISLR